MHKEMNNNELANLNLFGLLILKPREVWFHCPLRQCLYIPRCVHGKGRNKRENVVGKEVQKGVSDGGG